MVEKIKARYPDFNLTTDIIVGFPGETEEDFQRTCEVTCDVGFSHIHTFKYSVRSGTRAERMSDQVPEAVKQERSRIIRNLSDENKIKYRQSMVGKEQLVLVEKFNQKTGLAKGYGQHYIPVEFRSTENPHNQFVNVMLESVGSGSDPVVKGSMICSH
jgi:threonylcarbamoyladenosine tRNA methylthiotransferase MtaB